MIQIVEPDYYIKIGIKDDEVVSVYWLEKLIFEGQSLQATKTNYTEKKNAIRYLRQAIKFIVKR